MEMVSVSCNSCGAPLKVGAQSRFVTCQFCNAQLEVKRNDSSVFTEEMTRIARNTDQMAESLEVIKLQNEIEMLDRQAAAESVQSTRGAGSQSPGGSVFGLAFTVFFAIVCFTMAGSAAKSGAPGMFALVPVGMGLFALVAGVMGLLKSAGQAEQQADVRRRRDELASRLAELESQNKR